jgi:hypothetical protein
MRRGTWQNKVTRGKKKLGYEMPAADLEDKFEEVQRLLASKKAKWSKLTALATTSYHGEVQFCKIK